MTVFKNIKNLPAEKYSRESPIQTKAENYIGLPRGTLSTGDIDSSKKEHLDYIEYGNQYGQYHGYVYGNLGNQSFNQFFPNVDQEMLNARNSYQFDQSAPSADFSAGYGTLNTSRLFIPSSRDYVDTRAYHPKKYTDMYSESYMNDKAKREQTKVLFVSVNCVVKRLPLRTLVVDSASFRDGYNA